MYIGTVTATSFLELYEPHREKNNILHVEKLRHRSASQ